MICALRELFSFKPHPAKEELSTPISSLSVDIIRLLLSHLEGADLIRASRVCRSWNKIVIESDYLRRKIFEKFPQPLREFLSTKENYGKIPTLKIEGKIRKKESNDVCLAIQLPNGEVVYSLKISPEMMSAPVMFVQEPWKRTAIAIKYHVTYPNGSEGDLAIILHEFGALKPGVWTSSQDRADINDPYPRIISYAMPHLDIFVKLSTLFRTNWETNPGGEFPYLKKLLNGKPCGRIQYTPENGHRLRTILEPTFKNEKGKKFPTFEFAQEG